MHLFFKHFDISSPILGASQTSASNPEGFKPVIGSVKLLPLPGSIRFKSVDRLDEIVARAEQEATALASGGVHGIMVENTLDQSITAQAPDPARVEHSFDPAATVLMGHIVRRLHQLTGLPIGVQVLPNDPSTALGIAAVSQASMIRIPLPVGVKVAHDGFLHGQLTRMLSYQKQLAFSRLPLILMDLSTQHILPADTQSVYPGQLKPLTQEESVGAVGHIMRLARYIESQCPPDVLQHSVFVVSDNELSLNDIVRLRELLELPIIVWNQKALAQEVSDSADTEPSGRYDPVSSSDSVKADVSAYSAASGLILDVGIRKRGKNNMLPTIDMVKVENLIHQLQATESIADLEATDPDFFVGKTPGFPSKP